MPPFLAATCRSSPRFAAGPITTDWNSSMYPAQGLVLTWLCLWTGAMRRVLGPTSSLSMVRLLKSAGKRARALPCWTALPQSRLARAIHPTDSSTTHSISTFRCANLPCSPRPKTNQAWRQTQPPTSKKNSPRQRIVEERQMWSVFRLAFAGFGTWACSQSLQGQHIAPHSCHY